MDNQLISALETLKKHLLSSRQVSINRDINETWIIFTDGAFEPTNAQPASIGGILVNPNGQVVSFFGAYLPQPLLEEFLAKSSHPIYELEIFPFAGLGQDMVEAYIGQTCGPLFGQRCSKVCFS